ncbi:hypothetical protein [Streptomyces sp. NPDC007346]|uniref:hypothetical protein n=1 Tax=Streptomyces sp. NPDC007346 TaxID=3154682 RepID=UPI0034541245
MSPAHLHVVPDPAPEPPFHEAPGPGGQWTPLPPATWEATAPHLAPELLDDETAEEAGEPDQEEASAPRGYITVPDLRPYIDPRPLAALGPLAAEAARNVSPPLARALRWSLRALAGLLHDVGRMLAWYGRGIGVLLVLLTGWMCGKFGERGSLGARAGMVATVVYAAVKLTGEHPITPWAIGAVALLATVMAATGHIEIPEGKPAKKGATKGATKGDGKKKGAAEKDAKAPAKGKTAPAESALEETQGAAKEKPANSPAPSWKDRLRGRRAASAAPPTEASEDTPADPSEEPPGEADEAAAETPAPEVQEVPVEASPEPSREELIRGLHHLYRGGSGVLHTALAQHLSLPDTRALKRALDGAGIPYREGVRTPAGNGPGTHHEDIPPLPSPQSPPQGGSVVAGQSANANANNTANAPGEELSAQGTEWTPAERKQGFRIVPNPQAGPSASKVERRLD